MNVSQLAVYQIPSDALKLRRRSTVPFYNRRRALKHRQVPIGSVNIDKHTHYPEVPPTSALSKRTRDTTMNCSAVSTVTTTITVTECNTAFPTKSIEPLQNITYVSPPLPCLPTPETSSLNVNISSTHNLATPISNCTCKNLTTTVVKPSEPSSVAVATPSPLRKSSLISERSDVQIAAAAWSRVGYYTSAAPAQATGFSFLANLGDPQKSGTFD